MAQGGGAVSVRAERQEDDLWCVFWAEDEGRHGRQGIRRTWGRHFHVLSALENLKSQINSVGASQIIDFLSKNAHINYLTLMISLP